MRISGEPPKDEGSKSTFVHDFVHRGSGDEWTRLAAEIDHLERLCRSNNRRHPHARQPPCFNYHRLSTPQMQRATSVWIEPDPRPYPEEPCRWSWRPKTEFERAYFGEFSADKSRPSSRPDSAASEVCKKKKRDGENGEPGSGTRERLHEIFERNRYLRRKFFMGEAVVGGYFGGARSGYGSTETIASQSNRSSVSSGDRRSRCRSNVTIEGERFSHEARRRASDDYDDDDDDGSMNVTRVEGGGILATSKNGKLLVNVAAGNGWTNSRRVNGEEEEDSNDSSRRRSSLRGEESKPVSEIDRDNENNAKLPSDQLQNLCKSLPNLHACKNGKNSLFAEDFELDRQTDLSNSCADLNSFTLRRLKVSKPPPPLDLSRVNERYEEELEREHSRSNTVQVSLIRNYNCPLKGRPIVVRDECSSDENREGSIEGCSNSREAGSVETAVVEKNDRKYDSSLANRSRDRGSLDGDPVESAPQVGESVRKDRGEDREASSNLDKRDVCARVVAGNSMGEKEEEEESWNRFLTAYLSTMDELQSPQLVNNCKNSMMDAGRRETFHERRRRPPLSDHANSMNGGQAGNGSTLPSVYGPIPYSQ